MAPKDVFFSLKNAPYNHRIKACCVVTDLKKDNTGRFAHLAGFDNYSNSNNWEKVRFYTPNPVVEEMLFIEGHLDPMYKERTNDELVFQGKVLRRLGMYRKELSKNTLNLK